MSIAPSASSSINMFVASCRSTLLNRTLPDPGSASEVVELNVKSKLAPPKLPTGPVAPTEPVAPVGPAVP